MKKLFFFLLLLCSFEISAQLQIERAVIAQSGGSMTNDQLYVSHTIGQPITGTITSDLLHLTQGFEQSADFTSSVIDHEFSQAQFSYKIYPNPTMEKVFIASQSEKDIQYRLVLTDLVGHQHIHQQERSGNLVDLSLDHLPPGIYFLSFYSLDRVLFKTHLITKI